MKTVFAILISFFSLNTAYANSTLSCLLSTTTAPRGVEKQDANYFQAESFFQVIAIDYDPSLYGGHNNTKELYLGYAETDYEMIPVNSKEKATLRVSFRASGDAFGIYIDPVGFGRGTSGQSILNPKERTTAAASTAYRLAADGEVVITTISCVVK